MSNRKNLFVIHSWAEPETYARAMELVHARESGIADYSVPPWKAIERPSEVEASIRSRIATASTVVVLNTPGLHKRNVSSLEMEIAASMDKRIVVLQPHGNFWQPIPQVLDGRVYRVTAWRGDVLGRAIRGEYPYDGRIFDIAEKSERRQIVKLLSAGVGVLSLALLLRTFASYRELAQELAAEGIQFDHGLATAGDVAKGAVVGAILVGGITALLTEDAKAALWAAAAGGAIGAAVTAARTYQAALHGTSSVRVLALSAS
jgi:hypothetical protein